MKKKSIIKMNTVCVYFLRDKCNKDEDCKFIHDKNLPLPVCNDFILDRCPYGSMCLYNHGKVKINKPVPDNSISNKKNTQKNNQNLYQKVTPRVEDFDARIRNPNGVVRNKNHNGIMQNKNPNVGTQNRNPNEVRNKNPNVGIKNRNPNDVGNKNPKFVGNKNPNNNSRQRNSKVNDKGSILQNKPGLNKSNETFHQNNLGELETQKSAVKKPGDINVSKSTDIISNSKEQSSSDKNYEIIPEQTEENVLDLNKENYMRDVSMFVNSSNLKKTNKTLCPYGESSLCLDIFNCEYSHGLPCPNCKRLVINPFNDEKRINHLLECQESSRNQLMFDQAHQESLNIECCVCLEKIYEKSDETQSWKRFGLLNNCDHSFCYECITRWRKNQEKNFVNNVVRSCPICRIFSGFVIPSSYWPLNAEMKKNLIDDYRVNTAKIPCANFDRGRGLCKFGTSCFYKHEFMDGNIQSKDAAETLYYDEDGNQVSPFDFMVIDLLKDT